MHRRDFLKNTSLALSASVFMPHFTLFKNEIKSVRDGNWFDPNTWGGRVPTGNEEIFIKHSVTVKNKVLNIKKPLSITKKGFLDIRSCAINLDADVAVYGRLFSTQNIYKSKHGATIETMKTATSVITDSRFENISVKNYTAILCVQMTGFDPKQKSAVKIDVGREGYMRESFIYA